MAHGRAINDRSKDDALPVGKLTDRDLHRLVMEANAELLHRLEPDKVTSGTGVRYETTVDLALAAYYHYKGVRIVSIHRRGENGRGGAHQGFRFVFGCSVEVAERLRMEFLNSEMHKFDSSMRAVKKMFNEARGRGG